MACPVTRGDLTWRCNRRDSSRDWRATSGDMSAHVHSLDGRWPFDEAEDTAVVACEHVIVGGGQSCACHTTAMGNGSSIAVTAMPTQCR